MEWGKGEMEEAKDQEEGGEVEEEDAEEHKEGGEQEEEEDMGALWAQGEEEVGAEGWNRWLRQLRVELLLRRRFDISEGGELLRQEKEKFGIGTPRWRGGSGSRGKRGWQREEME